MSNPLSLLIKKQEQKIFIVKQNSLFKRRANCPRCATKILLNNLNKGVKLCFFCSNCQFMFEK